MLKSSILLPKRHREFFSTMSFQMSLFSIVTCILCTSENK